MTRTSRTILLAAAFATAATAGHAAIAPQGARLEGAGTVLLPPSPDDTPMRDRRKTAGAPPFLPQDMDPYAVPEEDGRTGYETASLDGKGNDPF